MSEWFINNKSADIQLLNANGKERTRTKVSVIVQSRLKQASNEESDGSTPWCINVSRTTFSIFYTNQCITNTFIVQSSLLKATNTFHRWLSSNTAVHSNTSVWTKAVTSSQYGGISYHLTSSDYSDTTTKTPQGNFRQIYTSEMLVLIHQHTRSSFSALTLVVGSFDP